VAAEIEEKVILDRNGLGVKESLPGLQDSTFSLASGKCEVQAVGESNVGLGSDVRSSLPLGSLGKAVTVSITDGTI